MLSGLRRMFFPFNASLGLHDSNKGLSWNLIEAYAESIKRSSNPVPFYLKRALLVDCAARIWFFMLISRLASFLTSGTPFRAFVSIRIILLRSGLFSSALSGKAGIVYVTAAINSMLPELSTIRYSQALFCNSTSNDSTRT